MIYSDIKHLIKNVISKECGSKKSPHYVLDCQNCKKEIYIRKYDLKKSKTLLCKSCCNAQKTKDRYRDYIKPKKLLKSEQRTLIYIKNCTECNELFIGKVHTKRYCSKSCRQKASNKQYSNTLQGRYNRAKAACTRSRYNNNDKRKFELTFEEYKQVYGKGKCFYCADVIPPNGTGLDRINSSKHYKIGNVVPCCRNCNTLKSNILSKEETLEVIKLLKNLRKKEDLWN